MFSRYYHQIALVLLFGTLSTFSGFGSAQAFQIADGGLLKVMQTGNPGTSASFTVNSKLRIEGRGAVVENNAGAVDWDAVEAAKNRSSTKINNIISVCDSSTGKCVNTFPTGTDTAYQEYENCIKGAGSSLYDCAKEWARDKDLLVYEDYLALQEEDETPTQVVEAAEIEEDFKTTAPKDTPGMAEKIAEVIVPPTMAELPVEVVPEKVTPVVAPTRTSVPVKVLPRREFNLNLQASTVQFPNFVGSTEAGVDINLGKEYYSCVNVPRFVVYNDLWKWLAYRLLFVLTSLVLIIFLLAFWVFLLWRSDRAEERPSGQRKKRKTKK